jgi:hypothetical protein
MYDTQRPSGETAAESSSYSGLMRVSQMVLVQNWAEELKRLAPAK